MSELTEIKKMANDLGIKDVKLAETTSCSESDFSGVVSSDFGGTKDPVILMVADMIRVPSVSQGHQLLIAQELVRQGWTKSC